MQASLAGMKPLPATQGDTQGAAPPQAAASTRTVNQMSLDIIALGLINSELDADEVKGGVCVCVCVCVRARAAALPFPLTRGECSLSRAGL